MSGWEGLCIFSLLQKSHPSAVVKVCDVRPVESVVTGVLTFKHNYRIIHETSITSITNASEATLILCLHVLKVSLHFLTLQLSHTVGIAIGVVEVFVCRSSLFQITRLSPAASTASECKAVL